MKIITTADSAAFDQWWGRAINDPTVWPFLSIQRYTAKPKIEDNDWDGCCLIDKTGVGLLYFSPSRNDGLLYASVSIWVLDVPARPMIALRMLAQLPSLCCRTGVKWIRSCVHESNVKARKINDKALGSPWGVLPFGAWNGLSGRYEAAINYQGEASRISERVAR